MIQIAIIEIYKVYQTNNQNSGQSYSNDADTRNVAVGLITKILDSLIPMMPKDVAVSPIIEILYSLMPNNVETCTKCFGQCFAISA